MPIDFSAILSDPAALAALAGALASAGATTTTTTPKARKARKAPAPAPLTQTVTAPAPAPAPAPVASNANSLPSPVDTSFATLTDLERGATRVSAIATHKFAVALLTARKAYGGPVSSTDPKKLGFAEAWHFSETRRAEREPGFKARAKPLSGSRISRICSAASEFPRIDDSNAEAFMERIHGYGERNNAKARAKAAATATDALNTAISWIGTAMNRGATTDDIRKAVEARLRKA